MIVYLFVVTFFLGCLNFIFKLIVNDNERDIGFIVVNVFREDFYVDDGFKSVLLVDEVVQLIEDVKEMCKRGGFRFYKFIFNSKEVISSVFLEDRAEEIKNIDLD